LRIAVYHNQPSGGARRALYELCCQLSSRHDIDVYTLESADETFLKSSDFANKVTVLPFRPRRLLRGGLYLNDLRRMQDISDLEGTSQRAAALIDGGGYDVALVDACRFLHTPSVLQYLETPSAYYCHHAPRRFLEEVCRPGAAPMSPYQRARNLWHAPAEKLYDNRTSQLDRRNVGRAGTVLTNSEHTRRIINDYYGRDAVVCRLGVDCHHFVPGTGTADDYVLSVGALEPHKGYDFLVRSIGACPPEKRPRLVIAGNTDTAGVGRQLTSLAESVGVSLDIRTNVNPLGQELLGLYQEARAFVFTAFSEPFGLVLLEAMACGLPVVSVAEGGPVEIVQDGRSGLLIERDVTRFAEAVSRLVGDEGLARPMGGLGRRIVEADWTWEAAGRRLEDQLLGLARGVQVAVP
jgi:glycosyltransferase involved in cell wall biosynthesis